MEGTFASLGLAGLFLSSFLSATLLPGNSEIVLLAFLNEAPGAKWPALALATLGNTLGGMTSYLIGRLFPKPAPTHAVAALKRYGPAALLLSWVPLIGDGLCVASGWLRRTPPRRRCSSPPGRRSATGPWPKDSPGCTADRRGRADVGEGGARPRDLGRTVRIHLGVRCCAAVKCKVP